MFTPIIIPIQQPEKSKCPECGKNENIISVCKHCGHEYEEDELKWHHKLIGVILGIIIILLFILFMWSCFDWLSDFDNKHLSLFKIISNNFKYIYSKNIW